jgi:hypothetical protein
MFRSLRWRIAVPYLILILLAMGGMSIYLSDVVRQSYLEELQGKLTAEAKLIGDAVEATSEWDAAGGAVRRLGAALRGSTGRSRDLHRCRGRGSGGLPR